MFGADNQFEFLAEAATVVADIVRIEAGEFVSATRLASVDGGMLGADSLLAPVWLDALESLPPEPVPEDQLAFESFDTPDDWIEPEMIDAGGDFDATADDASFADGDDGFIFADHADMAAAEMAAIDAG